MNPVLIKFERSSSVTEGPDFFERVADYALGELRLVTGRTFKVEKQLNGLYIFSKGYQIPRNKRYPESLILLIISIAAATLSSLLIHIGFIAHKFSTSHKEMIFKMNAEMMAQLNRGKKRDVKIRLNLSAPRPYYRKERFPVLDGLNLACKNLPNGEKVRAIHRILRFAKNHPQKLLQNKEIAFKEQAKAQAYNNNTLFYYIPDEIKSHIFTYVTNRKDLEYLKSVTTKIRKIVFLDCPVRALVARTKIDQITAAAEELNTQLVDLTRGLYNLNNSNFGKANYQSFHFDLAKWRSVKESLNPDLILKIAGCADECYLDLVEALAEYNIPTKAIKNEINDLNDLDPDTRLINCLHSTHSLGQIILTEAKNTIKGNILGQRKTAPIIQVEGQLKIGPFASLIVNPESKDWSQYERVNQSQGDLLQGKYVHFKHLIGKHQGDRVCLKQGEISVILRCTKNPEYGTTFEHDLVFSMRNEPMRMNVDFSDDYTIYDQTVKNYVKMKKKAREVYPDIKIVDDINIS